LKLITDLKIFQLIQKPQLRGAEIFASQLSNHLAALGHQCKLIALFEGAAKLPFHGEFLQLNRPLSKRLWDLAGWKQLAELMKNEKPDIIQANAGDTLKFAVLSKVLFGWRTPIVFRNANKMSDFIDTRVKYWFNRSLLKQVDHVISVSEQCSIDLVEYFSYPESKVTTVEIGIETDKIGPFPEDMKVLSQQGPLLLNVAGMVPEKNQAGLLRIFSQLLRLIPNAQLLIVGTGKLESLLKMRSAELGIQAQVHFLGTRSDVRAIMTGCRAFLLPSLIEGLPAVILEAMAARCSVVAYDVGGIGEVVNHRQTGMLIAKGDEPGFVAAIAALLEDDALSLKINDSASELVNQKFTNTKIAIRFEAVYRKLLSG
jgi:glycosyltransferase involved in cell wall biosynthesis